jgi:hypothetical protein
LSSFPAPSWLFPAAVPAVAEDGIGLVSRTDTARWFATRLRASQHHNDSKTASGGLFVCKVLQKQGLCLKKSFV